jgi:sugar transferase (PEP-CTERM/EpsH1 system associated)
MESLLYLTHRIPYPPNKGDKIRSYNMLKHLSERYRIYLGTFVDDQADRQHLPVLRSMCHEVCALDIDPKLRKLWSLTGFLRGEALSLAYYRNHKLHSWIDEKLRHDEIRFVLVFSSSMAQYVRGIGGDALRKVIDFVDLDSEKWREYSDRRSWPLSWLFRREAEALLEFESSIASESSVSIFVSKEEAELFRRRAPRAAARVTYIRNGVDSSYFCPDAENENPYPHDQFPLVFTGIMDYWANVDAVTWFAKEVFPLVRARVPQSCFYIVGARPVRSVQQLAELSGIYVTGTVPDTRPYLAHAGVVVAPMRIARGVQNKILEAMAMARPVIMTREAAEGLELPREMAAFVAEIPRALADRCAELLEDEKRREDLGRWAREHVIRNYNWRASLKQVEGILEADAFPCPLRPD